VEELKQLGDHGLNFPRALRLAMDDGGVTPEVRKFLIEALEHGEAERK
jgi:hypothetical protein